ncbi:Cobalt-zinc-cadmium resistance protein CzcA; Cation efflux system protein CusA [hydrothermal vent metagenome]|uniref:Cobalt-zinc-cadmium resistance protein CzcA Cation efflux system protein CusA n=1 Tax=hydrothermal vent metagenome TaxID=652676 RepID=A0A3B1CH91_9ZZZZ
MIRFIIEWCMRNPLLVCAVSIIVALSGAWSLSRISLDAVPDLSDVQVIISAKWMGRDPQTIDDQVTYPLATSMLAVPRVRDVRGYSFFGQSFVYVIFEDGTDIYWARSRVMEYLSQAQTDIPKDVTPTLGPDATGLGWVFIYTVEDTQNRYNLGELRAIQDWYLRYQLLSVPGVAEVASFGGAVRQYQITVDPKKLLFYNIALKKVIRSIRKSNNDVGGEIMELGGSEFMVRGRGYIRGIGDLENIVLRSTADGTPTLLKDVATVQMGAQTKRGVADKDGKGEVVAGIVVARYGANALDVIEGVKKKIGKISRGLPEGIAIRVSYDRSGLIYRAIDTLTGKLIEEMIIVALVTMLFLWHARSAVVASITLPLGVLASFIIMKAMGLGANIMSLGGIAVAIGAMVDAAVVMVENTHKHLEKLGSDVGAQRRWKAVLDASMEVGPALFFSLLIITVSFLPVFALQDQAGRLFKPLAFTKTFAMGASAILAITLVPVLTGLLVKGNIPPETRNPVSRLLITVYKPILRLALRFRKSVLVLAALVLLFTFIPYSKLGSEFMPPLKEGDILYMPTTVPGLPVAEATRILQVQDRLLKQFPEVRTVLGKIGRANTPTDPAPLSMVETHVALKPEEKWPARIIEDGFIRDVALEMTALLDSEIVMVNLPEGETAEQVERKSGWTLNSWIREEIQRGKKMISIKKELGGKLVETVSADLISYLEASGFLQKLFVKKAGELLAGFSVDTVALRKTTFEELTKNEMNRVVTIPGMPNWWLMPIETRIGMLTTGMKGLLGLKVRGEDLVKLEKIAIDLEKVLNSVPGTVSVSAERVMGGRYLDIDLDRAELARYGIMMEDAQAVIESAIGGKNITQTIEGRYRFPVNLRYSRELRDDPEKLKRVLLAASNGALIPLGSVSKIEMRDGPPMIKSENGLLITNVPVDIEAGLDIGTYVKRAQSAIDKAIEEGAIKLPTGYYMEWSGQYQFMADVNKKLKVIIPITLAIIFLLLFMNFGALTETLIIMLGLPFSVIGGIWLVYWLGYNMSVAVVVGFIALAGLAAETGVIMLVYLNMAYEAKKKQGLMRNWKDLFEAVIEGAVMRIRPITLVVSCLILGLLPIMWSTGVGSRPMQRMVAPMIGGLITATILTLIVIPVIYSFVKKTDENG